MKKLIILFLLLLFVVWVGFLIHQDPGYILITYHSWSIETSLWVGLAITLILFAAFHILLKLLYHTAQINTHWQTWRQEHRERKSNELTYQAVHAFITMQWKQAETLFSKSTKGSKCSLLSYIAAAYAAQKLNALDRCHQYLRQFSKQASSHLKTTQLIKSLFYIYNKQWQEALTILTKLKNKYPKDPSIVHYMLSPLEHLKDWNTIKTLLPLIKKTGSIDEYRELEHRVYIGILNKVTHSKELDQAWDHFSKSQKTTAVIAATYAKKAIELHYTHKAVNVIENALKHHWNVDLIKYYGQLKGEYIYKQINYAESWLKKYPNDPDLLICLGRLCILEKLWGKAGDYLNKAAQIAATREVYYELGRLLEATNNIKEALKFYRKSSLAI